MWGFRREEWSWEVERSLDTWSRTCFSRYISLPIQFADALQTLYFTERMEFSSFFKLDKEKRNTCKVYPARALRCREVFPKFFFPSKSISRNIPVPIIDVSIVGRTWKALTAPNIGNKSIWLSMIKPHNFVRNRLLVSLLRSARTFNKAHTSQSGTTGRGKNSFTINMTPPWITQTVSNHNLGKSVAEDQQNLYLSESWQVPT